MNWDIERTLAAAVFTGTRISGLLIFAPFLGSSSIPMRVKAGLAVALTFLLYPVCGPARISLSELSWGRVMVSEAVVGLVMGLSVQFIFDAAQVAGQLLGIQMGYSLVNILDPQTQVDTPVLSTFFQLVALLIFLSLNVHHWLFRGIVASFTYLPAGTAAAGLPMVAQLLHMAGGIWLAAVQIAAPALLATMMADAVLGFLGKASPQLPVLFLGLSVKSVLGLLVLCSGVVLWPQKFEQSFAGAIAHGEQLLHLAR